MSQQQIAVILEQIDRVDRELERGARERAALMRQLREVCPHPGDVGAASEEALDLSDLIRPNQAEKLFGMSRPWLYRKAKDNPYTQPGGFSYRSANGDYLYSRARLELFIKRNPPRKRRKGKAGTAG
jgi:hypothetical protein